MFFTSFRSAVIVTLLLFGQTVGNSEINKSSDRKAIALRTRSNQAVAGPVSIQYNLISLGGNVYQYVYTITNNGSSGSAAVKLFDILFDTALYQESSLQIVTPSSLHSQWSEELYYSFGGVPSMDYDALALSGGIPPGGAVSGFAVQFTWLGSGVPGSQPFQIFDPDTFQLLQTGQTFSAQLIPAASTPSLIVLGVGIVLIVAYKMRLQDRRLRRCE